MSSFNTSKFMNKMFRRVEGVVWCPISGATCLRTTDGIYNYVPGHDGETGSVSVNLIDVSIALPGFAMATPFEQAQIGDLVVGDGVIGWIDEKLVNSYRIKDHRGFTKIYSPPKVEIMGVSGALIVRNFFSAAGGAQNVNSMLPLLMMAGDDSKIEKLLPFLLMQQGQSGGQNSGGAAPAMNPMLMMMLMKDGGFGGSKKSGSIDPMMLMMMGGFGGGAGGMNPMALMALAGGLGNDEPTPLPAPIQRGLPPLSSLNQF